MKTHQGSFAERIRQAARRLQERGLPITCEELGHEAGVKTRRECQAVRWTVRDMLKRGELERVEPGVFRLASSSQDPPQIQEKMWRVLRARRRVTVEDLQELAGASRLYALEWLQMLVKYEIVRKGDDGLYQMVKDPVEMPRNRKKAEKLRRLRRKWAEEMGRGALALGKAAEALRAAAETWTELTGLEDEDRP